MMGVLHKFLWFCQLLVTVQNRSLLRRDASLSNVEALYDTYKSSTKSEVTYYGTYVGGGACALDPLSPMASQRGWIRVAAGRADFQNSLGCGMCVEITGSGKGSGISPVNGTMKAIVHDLCGGCKKGGFDLFIDGDGRWEVSSRSIECPTLPGPDGNIMFRFTGSNPWYIKLQARNVKIPAAGIEVLKNGAYSCLKRTRDNYFTGDGLGQVDFPMTVRVTSLSGEKLETVLPSMKNDKNIPSDIQFGGISTGGGPSGIKCFGQGNKPPYPAGGMGATGSTPGVGRPSTAGLGNRVPVRPSTGKGPSLKKPSSGTTSKGGNGDFCENNADGVHPDPDDCQGFILCDAGKTYRKKCAPGLLFNPKHLGCDLPARVKCRRGSQDRPSQAEKRGKLNLAGKPAVEIVIQKEKTEDTHTAPNTEGIQAIRPNEENTAAQNGNLEAGTSTTTYGGRRVTSKIKEDGQANEIRISPLNQTPSLNTTATEAKEKGQTTNEDTRKTSSAKDESRFVTVTNTNNTSIHNNGPQSSESVGPQKVGPLGTTSVERTRGPAEKGDGLETPSTWVNATKGSEAPVRGTANVGTEGFQSNIITELPDKLGNRYALHEGRVDTSETNATVSANNKSASKGLGMKPVSEQGGDVGTTWNAAEREKQGTALSRPGTTNNNPLSSNVPQQGLVKEGSSYQALNKGSAQGTSHQGTHVSGGQETPNTGASKATEKETAVSLHGSEAGVLTGANGPVTAPGGVHVMTLEGLKPSRPSKPAVSREKGKSGAPLVGITIKQTGQPDKYVLVNKRHKLRTKHNTHA